jgi:hypothetical protein
MVTPSRRTESAKDKTDHKQQNQKYMNTETEIQYAGEATYCPEDNKLRLYVGRVPRDEYLKLRSQGWVALPKQRENGGGDFAATWTPERRQTALEYAGFIGDEDKGPAERAAERAERFSEYRDKRTFEAVGHADAYDAGPSAFGFQSQAKAEKAAQRHDRHAENAGDSWSKAEYWTSRTAGVIGHALYKSTPGVRMGRIKELEKHIRAIEKSRSNYATKFSQWQRIAALTDAEKQNALARHLAYYEHGDFTHPRTGEKSYLYAHTKEGHADPLNGAELAALWLSKNKPLGAEDSWLTHYRLRLAYESQMLAAAGGMLEQCDVLPGGKLGGKLIIKVSKSSVTKRATSCDVLGPKVSRWTYKASNIPGTEFAAYKLDLERMKPEFYTAPTPESLAELEKFNSDRKTNAPKSIKPPLINPTDVDAERLQAVFNERNAAQHARENPYGKDYEPAKVLRITQSAYSAASKGSYAKAETRGICAGGNVKLREWNIYSKESYAEAKRIGPAICEVRLANYDKNVIILTDKPQKPFPPQVWKEHEAAPAMAEA